MSSSSTTIIQNKAKQRPTQFRQKIESKSRIENKWKKMNWKCKCKHGIFPNIYIYYSKWSNQEQNLFFSCIVLGISNKTKLSKKFSFMKTWYTRQAYLNCEWILNDQDYKDDIQMNFRFQLAKVVWLGLIWFGWGNITLIGWMHIIAV